MEHSTDPLDRAVDALLAPREESTGEPMDSELSDAADKLLEPEESDTDETDEVEAEDTEEESDDSSDDEQDEYEDESEEDDSEEVEEPRYTVKVDGKEVEVTLDELRRGYSGQRKIQLGMQEAAEARKVASEAAQRAAQYEQQLTALFNQVQQQGVIAPPQPPSPELASTDPLGYIEADARFRQQWQAYQTQQAQIQQTYQLNQQKQEAERRALLERESQLARQRIPELSDAKRAPEFKKKLVEFGQKELGFSLEELGGVQDHRALYAMHLARIGYEAMQGKTKAEAKAKPAKPVVKAGAKKVQNPKRAQANEAKKRLRKTGSIEDALSLIMDS